MYNGYTVVVTIGRNIGAQPMLPALWQAFKTDVFLLVSTFGVVVQRPLLTLGSADQVGVWDGHTEDAATIVALCKSRSRIDLVSGLRHLAKQYKQDAIGLIVVDGTEHLVRA